jgi:hypothetical protein
MDATRSIQRDGRDCQSFVVLWKRDDECDGLAFGRCPFNPVSPFLKSKLQLRFPVDRSLLKNALCILRIDAAFSPAFLKVIVIFHEAIFETPPQPFGCVRLAEVFTSYT